MANDEGTNAWVSRYGFPANSALEGSLPSCQLLLFPITDFIELALTRFSRPPKESWPGTRVCLLPAQQWKNWFPKLGACKHATKRSPESALLMRRTGGRPREVPNEEKVAWRVLCISKHA